MKTVTAIIRPTKVADVRDALSGVGIEMFTVTRVMGCGHNDCTLGSVRGAEENMLNKTRIEIMVADYLVKRAIEAIIMKCRTGAPGDGKIFVMDVPQYQIISAAAPAAPAAYKAA